MNLDTETGGTVDTLDQTLRDRGADHIADLLVLSAERPWFRNETVEAPAPAEAPAAPAAPVVPPTDAAALGAVTPPAAGEAAAPVVEAPAVAAPLTVDSPEFRQVLDVTGSLGRLITEHEQRAEQERLTAEETARTSGDGLPELDFTQPESVIAHAVHAMRGEVGQILQEALGPIQGYLPVLEGVARTEGEKITSGLLEAAGVPETIGEGDNQVRPREMAVKLAGAYMRSGMQPEQAVNQAAGEVKDLVDKLGGAAVGEHIDRATTLRTTQPAPASAAVEDGGAVGRERGLDPLRPTRYRDTLAASLEARMPAGT